MKRLKNIKKKRRDLVKFRQEYRRFYREIRDNI